MRTSILTEYVGLPSAAHFYARGVHMSLDKLEYIYRMNQP